LEHEPRYSGRASLLKFSHHGKHRGNSKTLFGRNPVLGDVGHRILDSLTKGLRDSVCGEDVDLTEQFPQRDDDCGITSFANCCFWVETRRDLASSI
jgi:hypothetical protein